MQKVQEGKEESDLATISAWSKKKTNSRMLKQHLTTPQYVMWEDLKRRLKCANQSGRCKPSMKTDARQARLIRGLQRLAVLADERRRDCWQQNIVQEEVQAATVKALNLAVIAQAQVT